MVAPRATRAQETRAQEEERMPIAPLRPGVWIEEIPSGLRTITGVATSIAVFVGWAPRGPTDRPSG